MESAFRTSTERVLMALKVLTWIVFIGLMVKAGAIVFSYVVTLINPEGAKNFYSGMNLYEMRQSHLLHFSLAAFFMVALAAMQAYIAYLLIKILALVNLRQPFTIGVARILESMSYDLVAIWAVSMVQIAHSAWWSKTDPSPDWGGGETLFVAGLVFVISQIFKRGVELQSESDFTV